jgi:hypothetical protein
MLGAVGVVARVAERAAVVGLLVAAGWHDDDPVPHDPLISA